MTTTHATTGCEGGTRLLLTARLDDRIGEGRIGSRIGLESAALVFDGETDMTALVAAEMASSTAAGLAAASTSRMPLRQ
mgnify:CR=1 FL=1